MSEAQSQKLCKESHIHNFCHWLLPVVFSGSVSSCFRSSPPPLCSFSPHLFFHPPPPPHLPACSHPHSLFLFLCTLLFPLIVLRLFLHPPTLLTDIGEGISLDLYFFSIPSSLCLSLPLSYSLSPSLSFSLFLSRCLYLYLPPFFITISSHSHITEASIIFAVRRKIFSFFIIYFLVFPDSFPLSGCSSKTGTNMFYFQLVIMAGTVLLAYYFEYTDTFPVHIQGFFCFDKSYSKPYPGPEDNSKAPPVLVYSLVTAIPTVTVSLCPTC